MRLRPLTQEDSKDFFDATHNDWTIHHALRDYFCETLENAEQLVATLLADSKKKPFAIIGENNEFVGVLTFYYHTQTTIEISSYISKEHRGRGYGYLALRQIFLKYPGYRFLFDVAPENTRSLRVMQKIGASRLNDEYYFVDTW